MELLYFQGSYYIAESASHAVKTYFSSQTGGGLGVAKAIHINFKRDNTYVKMRAVLIEKRHKTFYN